jgi:hypothetical protein
MMYFALLYILVLFAMVLLILFDDAYLQFAMSVTLAMIITSSMMVVWNIVRLVVLARLVAIAAEPSDDPLPVRGL